MTQALRLVRGLDVRTILTGPGFLWLGASQLSGLNWWALKPGGGNRLTATSRP
jgi:hypothetical protein